MARAGLASRPWVTRVIESLGYVGVAALIALENVFPPIPSELILPLTGFLAGQGRFWLPAAVLAATVGSVVGALILYGLARWLGEHRLRSFVGSFGKFFLLKEGDLDRASTWFERHGGKAVLIGRLVPVVRSLVSIPAGLALMPLPRFVLYTAIGSAVWNGAVISLGWALGDRWEEVQRYGQVLEYAVLAALVVGIGWFVLKRWRHQAQRA
jgi:membrane protein DedA with SNARE-associated domain